MTTQAVHWHEGMFLRPQHFQRAERYLEYGNRRASKWDSHYNWGVRKIALDEDALANNRLVIPMLEARLRDGTMVAAPDDGVLPMLDLKQAFAAERTLVVYLAVPVLQLAKSNVAATGNDAANGTRYMIHTLNVEDENTGTNPQPVQMRQLSMRLLTSNQDHAGYEVLPLVRIKKADRAEAVPQVDESYIPPLLSCDAWNPLSNNILTQIYDRIGKKLELLSAQVVSRNMTFDSQGQGDRLLFEQLRVMNESYAPLSVLLFAQGVHPLDIYRELAAMIGKMAIFSATRRPSDLPRYDHDDLSTCFWSVKQTIDALLDIVIEPEYKERPFIGAGMRMQVALEPAWLEAGQRMYVGVQCALTPEQCDRLLTRGLDTKIGSSDHVDQIFRLGQAGLQFSYVSHPPRSLPARPGLIYFQVDRDSQADEWERVSRSLTLAMRLNENLIVSSIQAQRSLTIKFNGQSTTLQFTLYVVPVDLVGE